jgi:hypothetical protein
MVLFTNKYFLICPLLSAPKFPIMIDPAQIAWLCNLSAIAFKGRSPVYALKRAYMLAIFLRCAKVSDFESFLSFNDVQILKYLQ